MWTSLWLWHRDRAFAYYIDYNIASLHKVEKGAFGYGSYFALSLMDRHYHSGMSVEEAIDRLGW